MAAGPAISIDTGYTLDLGTYSFLSSDILMKLFFQWKDDSKAFS
jgi:hypothetical protein